MPILVAPLIHTNCQLKTIYNGIQKYQETSGIHWDDRTGANINTEAEASVWTTYVNTKVRQYIFHIF